MQAQPVLHSAPITQTAATFVDADDTSTPADEAEQMRAMARAADDAANNNSILM
jgi:3-oxoacyl-(acyl-carrier-protein) synthase